MNYIQEQKRRIKSFLPTLIIVVVTAIVTFSFTFFVMDANAETTVAQTCIKQQSQYWNELQLLKQNIKDNLDKVQTQITVFEDGLTDTITSVQTGMADNNKDNKQRVGQGL